MAKVFLIPIDLGGNEIRNVLAQGVASDPVSPAAGQFWFNTVSHVLRYFDGTSVIDLTTASTDAATLQSHNGAYYLARANHTGSQTASTISDFDTQVRTSRLDQMATPSADVAFGTKKITGLGDPSSAQDAATKAYVDAAAAGIDWKASVRVATTVAGTLSTSFANGQTVDGVVLATGDRILIKNQVSGPANGIYVVASSGSPTRATDADSNAEVTAGMAVFVEEGTANADSGWLLTNDGAIVLGTTALVFTQFTALGSVTAGAGLTKTGSTLDVGAGTGISVAADSVGIDTAVVVQKFAADVGDGASTSITVTHSLGTRDVVVAVYRKSDNVEVVCDVTRTSTSVVTLGFSVAPTSNQYRCVVHA